VPSEPSRSLAPTSATERGASRRSRLRIVMVLLHPPSYAS
jgi:hypothetical protein